MRKLIWVISILILLGGCSQKRPENLVRIGIIKVPNDTVIAIQNEWIKTAYEDLGYEVEFLFFDSGVSMNQAFASGSLDIAEMGYTNSIVSAVKKLPVELFWIHDVIGSSEALVVSNPSIKSVKELKGKTIATIFGSTSHFSLLKTLEMNGMDASDVTLLNMNTAEIVAAWDRGDLDASYTWEPTLSKIKTSGTVLIDSVDLKQRGYMTSNVGLVHQTFTQKHPDLLCIYIQAMDKSYQLKKEDPEKVIYDAVDYLDINYEDAKTQLNGSTWLSLEEQVSDDYLGNGFLNVFYETAVYWNKYGFIDETLTMEEIRKFVNTSYVQEVIDNDSN